jgi:hypothetical protein
VGGTDGFLSKEKDDSIMTSLDLIEKGNVTLVKGIHLASGNEATVTRLLHKFLPVV